MMYKYGHCAERVKKHVYVYVIMTIHVIIYGSERAEVDAVKLSCHNSPKNTTVKLFTVMPESRKNNIYYCIQYCDASAENKKKKYSEKYFSFDYKSMTMKPQGNTALSTFLLLGYERVDLPLYKVADTPFHARL